MNQSNSCPHCGRPTRVVNEYKPATCGASACQEKDYRLNQERNALRRRRTTVKMKAVR